VYYYHKRYTFGNDVKTKFIRKVENIHMNVQHKEKGFTIIEVVLVLAIAGLIFLMVFIALPALQRNQRDTARKNDVSTIAAAVTSFTINDLSDNTDVNKVTIGSTAVGLKANPADGEVLIVQGRTCGTSDTSGTVLAKGTLRQFVVVTKLESGGGQAFCQTS
jgi:prepilin-type N-terminal cleavage/methylation domain-containing protein